MARLLRKRTVEKRKRRVTEESSQGEPVISGGEPSSAGREPLSQTSQPEAKKKLTFNVPTKTGSSGAIRSITSKWRWLDQSVQFLREVKVELKKVAWPSRKQTLGSTVVVIFLVLMVTVFLGFVDIGLSSIVRMLLQ